MNKHEMHIDLSKLTRLRKKLGTNMIVKVGVLGADASAAHEEPVTKYDAKTGKPYRVAGFRSGLTNAALAIIHIFGSITRGIPPRDFLRAPLLDKSKEIVQFLGNKEIKKLIEAGEKVQVFKLLGLKAEQIVYRAFVTGGFGKWPALKPQTIKRKGSSKPLIDTGQLPRSVSSEVVSK